MVKYNGKDLEKCKYESCCGLEGQCKKEELEHFLLTQEASRPGIFFPLVALQTVFWRSSCVLALLCHILPFFA